MTSQEMLIVFLTLWEAVAVLVVLVTEATF